MKLTDNHLKFLRLYANGHFCSDEDVFVGARNCGLEVPPKIEASQFLGRVIEGFEQSSSLQDAISIAGLTDLKMMLTVAELLRDGREQTKVKLLELLLKVKGYLAEPGLKLNTGTQIVIHISGDENTQKLTPVNTASVQPKKLGQNTHESQNDHSE